MVHHRFTKWLVVLIVVASFLFASSLTASVGGVSAQGQKPTGLPTPSISNSASPQTALSTAFTYQGELKNNGDPVNANCDFQFALYDTLSGGNQVEATQAVSNTFVSNGLFTVVLDFGNVFTGDARWLDVALRCPAGSGAYTSLTPRQPLTAMPYALGLQPGAVISGTAPTGLKVINSGAAGIFGQTDSINDAGVYGYNSSNGVGMYGQSDKGIGVKGYSADNGVGVYGFSKNDTGVDGSGGYAGVFGISSGGTGVSGRSSSGTGVSGSSSIGNGMYGSSSVGNGVYGYSLKGYGLSGEGGNVGVYAHNTQVPTNTAYLASGCCAGDFYGDVNVHGNLTVSGSKTGYVVDLAVNADSDTLSVGDVVAIVGNTTPVIGTIPVARVVKANGAYQTGVIGIVDQHVLRDAANPTAKDEPVTPGDYVNIVTLGMFRTIKVDASFGAIHAGDLLVASPHAGYAMKAIDRAQAVGAIIGKALGNLETGTGTMPVIVTLQ